MLRWETTSPIDTLINYRAVQITRIIDIPYQLCVSFTYARYSQKVKPIYVGFTANEDFESLIGQVEVPAELASE